MYKMRQTEQEGVEPQKFYFESNVSFHCHFITPTIPMIKLYNPHDLYLGI